jgi:hypothetical protein
MTGLQLKRELKLILGIKVERQVLVFSSRVIKNEDDLTDCGTTTSNPVLNIFSLVFFVLMIYLFRFVLLKEVEYHQLGIKPEKQILICEGKELNRIACFQILSISIKTDIYIYYFWFFVSHLSRKNTNKCSGFFLVVF